MSEGYGGTSCFVGGTQAAMDMASGIGDTGIRTAAELIVVSGLAHKDPDAAIQWLQSLPAGPTKDVAASGISWSMAGIDPQAAMNMAKGIADKGIRTEAQKKVAGIWQWKDPSAATQWIKSSSLPREVKAQRVAKAHLLPETPLPRPIIVPPSGSR